MERSSKQSGLGLARQRLRRRAWLNRVLVVPLMLFQFGSRDLQIATGSAFRDSHPVVFVWAGCDLRIGPEHPKLLGVNPLEALQFRLEVLAELILLFCPVPGFKPWQQPLSLPAPKLIDLKHG
jgi:hypothetical protein